MRSSLLTGSAVAAVVAAVAMWSCGGGSSYGGSSTPTTPSPTTPSPGTVTVNIVGSSGNKAYSPNPVQVGTGDTLVFKNSDVTTHHVVMDDGSADLGDLAPGASKSTTFRGVAGKFHCTIHSSMVGAVNESTAPEPPECMNPGYCG